MHCLLNNVFPFIYLIQIFLDLFSNNGLDLFLWALFIPDTFVTKDKW